MVEPPMQVPTDFRPDNTEPPYWKFPPFPQIEGRNVLSFKDFRPAGLRIVHDDDEEEVDGLGIPTATLRVTHDPDKPRRKRRKGGRSNGTTERPPWNEEWAELKQKPPRFDPLHDRHDRMDQADSEFQLGRVFPPLILTFYNEFRFFIGLTDTTAYDKKPKRSNEASEQRPADDPETPGDAEGADDGSMTDDEGPPAVSDDPFDHTKTSPYDLDVRVKEDRMSLFLDNPERAVKVFFSSHFFLRGLSFGEQSVMCAPMVVRFFLEFLLRHEVIPELSGVLKRAVEATTLASDQLPRTRKVSWSFPDAWGVACKDLFGTLDPPAWGIEGDEIFETSEPQGRIMEIDPDVPAPELLETLEISGASATEVLEDATNRDLAGKFSGLNVRDGDSESPAGDILGPKDPWKEHENSGASATDEELMGWNDIDAEPTWGAPLPRANIFPFVGPSSFVYTHIAIRAERSNREIVAVYPPVIASKNPPGNVSLFHANLASVVLKPWDSQKDDPDIPRPTIICDNAKSQGYLAQHDPLKDNITVLVAPSAIEGMSSGMCIGGVFVQVIQRPETIADKKPSKKPSKLDGRMWWYAEAVTEVFPCFWERYKLP